MKTLNLFKNAVQRTRYLALLTVLMFTYTSAWGTLTQVSASEIEDGEKYIIVGNINSADKYLTPAGFAAGSSTCGTYSSELTETAAWTFTSTGDGGWQISMVDNETTYYLGHTATNNGVKSLSTYSASDCKFTISATTPGNKTVYMYAKNRYLSVYYASSIYNYRCYNSTQSSSSANSTLKLYHVESDAGCTAGDVNSLHAGDVVVMHYGSYELNGITSNNGSYWGDYSSCGATPSGVYPLTVEAGSSSGTWSFKNGDNYLSMSADQNMLTTSTTKNANSSWTVSFSSGNATITNSSYTGKTIKFNTSTLRFCGYSSSSTPTSLVKLYKYCDDIKYYVTYYGNGNTGGSVPTDVTAYTSAQSATILGNTGSLVRTDCTWAGWNTKADGSGTDKAAGSTISMSGGSVSLYAKWTCSVTWKVNNTNYTTGTPTSSVVAGNAITTKPTDPDPDDYCGAKFVGWTTDENYVHNTSPLYVNVGDFTAVTGNIIYYAVFADYAD